jgi:hypothetical protein
LEEEESGSEVELEVEPETISPRKSPREDAAAPAFQPETTTKLKFDDFLNLMEVF